MDFRQWSNSKLDSNGYVCPSDRQLALRAKLSTGWSCGKNQEPLRPEERAAIISVIQRNEVLEMAERKRIDRLFERVEKIRQRALDRGPNHCYLCGDSFGFLRNHRIICENCHKPVCGKCCLDISLRRWPSLHILREIWFCHICSETRELWKKTGAWFYKSLPNYEKSNANEKFISENILKSPLIKSRTILCDHKKSLKKLSMRIENSSSSEEELLDIKDSKVINHLKDNSHSLESWATNSFKMKTAHLKDCENVNYSINDITQDLITLTSLTPDSPANSSEISSSPMQSPNIIRSERKESFRLGNFGSIRSLLDSTGISAAERKLFNAFNIQNHRNSNVSQIENTREFDSVSTISTLMTNSTLSHHESSDCNQIDSQNEQQGAILLNDNSIIHKTNFLNNHYRDPLLGWLELALTYKENLHTLDVCIVRARDLPAMDTMGLTDPYCQLNILTKEGKPKYRRWQKTRTVHKTRHPEFNENVQFLGIQPEELSQILLYIKIFDEDKYGHDFLGAAKIYLSTIHNINKYRMFVPLGDDDCYKTSMSLVEVSSHGKILLSLCYNSRQRNLIVKIKQCIDLKAMDSNGSSDPFIKLQMKPDLHRNKKCKTRVKWRTLNPIFNEEFQFEASPQELNKQCLVLTVWDRDIGKSNDFLGSLVIGYNSKGERLRQWLDCIRLPDQYHDKWHCLAGDSAIASIWN